jgi:uncharacterized membrane protein YdjX (TVP38/TMEM64 family)
VLAEAVAMFAGLTSLAPARFAAIVALANLPHSFIYGWAGARFGLNPSPAALGWAVGAGAAVPAAAYLLYALWRRRPGLQSADAVDYRGR